MPPDSRGIHGLGSCFLALLGAWLLGSCSGDQTTAPPEPATPIPSSVLVSPATVALVAVGDTVRLEAQVRDQNGNPMPAVAVTWSSGAPAVATVDPTGLVTAVANGSATITAGAGSVAGSASVTVQQAPATLTLVPDSLTFEALGETATLAATVADANGHAIEGAPVVWTSGDTAVATVDSTGLVTAVATGRTAVTSTVGELEASAAVIVEFQAVSILLEPSELSFTALGDTARLTAVPLDGSGKAGHNAPVEWASSDTTVATVGPSGLVTSVGNGATSVSATSGSASARVTVTVQQAPATLALVPDSLAFEGAGDTATVRAVVADANGHEVAGATAAWASRDASVASVDSTGLVTAVRPGSTAVTATVDSLTASAEVKVFDISSDRDVLEFLYRTTDGDGWRDNTNWLTDAPLSGWTGVTTWPDGRVRYLELRDNNLKGPIPRSLGQLDRLFILSLDGNSLTGRIPSEIGELRGLRDLYLSENQVSGPLPPEMGGMAGLRYLSVSGTNLSGPLPETFARLRLTRLYMSRTNLCLPPGLMAWYDEIEQKDRDPLQCIPETSDREALVALYEATNGPDWDESANWLSELPINTWSGVKTNEDGHVTELVLSSNNLSGPLPPEIGDLVHLERLRLFRNDLSGPIPPEIGRLAKVRNLALSSNQFEGPIPPEIGGLVSVDTLFLSHNNLSGPIPSEIGSLESLERLALFNNQLTGPLPASLGRLKTLVNLGLTDNRIDGPLPREIGDMTSLEELSIYRNEISGSLPPELGKLKALKELAVSSNRLMGPIPPELGDLTSLEDLSLSRNAFSGSIPPELGRLSNLEYLWLFQNDLTGEIPPQLGELSRLRQLQIGTNPLTGRIPAELGRLPVLETLSLGRTNLSGPIPPELGQLPLLTSLGLCSSNLSGSLPPELGDIRTLERLSLCHNPGLSGLLPRSLMNLGVLRSSLSTARNSARRSIASFRSGSSKFRRAAANVSPPRWNDSRSGSFSLGQAVFPGPTAPAGTVRRPWTAGTASPRWTGECANSRCRPTICGVHWRRRSGT